MHAAKAFAEFKKKLKKSERGEYKEDATEILKEYIRKFMKNTDYQKHFEPTATKIINDYGLVSPSGEPIIENLIKLHLPAQQKDMMCNDTKKIQRNYNKLQALLNSSKSSTNDSTHHKSRANSNDTNKQAVMQSSINYASSNNIRNLAKSKRPTSKKSVDKTNPIISK